MYIYFANKDLCPQLQFTRDPCAHNTNKQKIMKIYTGCPRRNVKYFGRVFLMLNYTDITQNTYIQS